MKGFHSTVSRRDFMKGLGLASAGLGAAGAIAPAFHDLDEVASAPGGVWKRPWWVKQNDFGVPVIDLDWSLVQRYDMSQPDKKTFPYRSSTHPTAVYNRDHFNELVKKRINEIAPKWETDSIRDLALQGAAGAVSFYDYYGPAKKHHFLGLEKASTPDQRKMAKWEGTPEENLRMVRQAARFFGASDVGVVVLDENTKKLIYAKESDGIPYVFEDVDKAYTTAEKRVIPNKFKYMVVWSELQATELTLREPSNIGKSATSMSYSRIPMVWVQMQEFFRGLGYQAINGSTGALAPSNPFGVLAGVGEHSRMCFPVVSPEYGSMLRGMNRFLTDLPLEPTPPIDAGISRFCIDCMTCAKTCTFDALPLDEPTWDLPGADTGVPFSPTGFKGWRLNTVKCSNCAGCQAACPFNSSGRSSFIHEFVAGTQSITPVFNSFFATMEEKMKYGLKDPDTWWDSEEFTYGINPKFIKHK